MILYQTQRIKNAIEEPTQLDIERIIARRSNFRTLQEKNKLKWLEAGEVGEQIIFEYLNKYGNEDWVIIRNMWLSNGGPFEADFIVLTNHRPYLFEVKNYTSDFIYEDGVTKFNNQINSGNPIYQTRRNRINLEKICQLYSNEFQVNGALILVGMDNYTEINSKIDDIEIIKRTELRHYIQKIATLDHSFKGKPFNKKDLLKQIERHEIDRNYGPQGVSKETIEELQKGVQCPSCNHFGVEINRKLTFCPCGFKETREIAILRTICEYGVLTFNKPLRIGELLTFFGGQISRDSLRLVLTKYFKEIKKGRYSYFINLKLPLYKLYKKFSINDFVYIQVGYQAFDKMTNYL